MPPVHTYPKVTVIALCYNHERFVLECLNSIRGQTFKDFQLIVTDDASHDRSANMIALWLERNHPNAEFIRHERNLGICRTLNEALRLARGEYISMISTDDTWESNKVQLQYEFMNAAGEDVCAVYSDAHQMDEEGRLLEKSFLEAHGVAHIVPTGRIFADIANGNFIPAMSTLIRRKCLEDVGGYDESLTYEDYDMWLRLSNRYKIEYLPGKIARYRVVDSSMVRTLFARPTVAHSDTIFRIAEKWLQTDLLGPEQRRRWVERQRDAAYNLYVHGDQNAAHRLWTVFWRAPSVRLALLAATRSLGITRQRAKQIASWLARSATEDRR